jgi:nitronate monooxygenase
VLFAALWPTGIMRVMTVHEMRDLFRLPVVVAPMAGGPSNPALVAAAADAGAIGFLAGGYKTASAVAAEIAEVRAATAGPFGVNLFVPGEPSLEPERVAAYMASLAEDARVAEGTVGDPVWDDDGWADKVAEVLAAAPPMVSFTFGCPSPDIVAAFRAAGSIVAVTVTSPAEAEAASAVGADLLCAQGIEAGAHRGVFSNSDGPGQDYGLLSLIGEVARVTGLPQIAAGGIVSPAQVRAVLAAGAVAAQCGTAFLRCPESGAHPAYKAALASPRYGMTAITRAFSGRPARGLLNRFMLDHADAPAAYPEINNATRALRAAAAKTGDTDRMSLWAGQGFRSATDRPASEVIEMLAR